jgi:hypothetical protein
MVQLIQLGRGALLRVRKSKKIELVDFWVGVYFCYISGDMWMWGDDTPEGTSSEGYVVSPSRKLLTELAS